MSNSLMEYRDYLKSEYGSADYRYVFSSANRKARINHLKRLSSTLKRENRALAVGQSSGLYDYFSHEYKNEITYNNDTILFPNMRLVKTKDE